MSAEHVAAPGRSVAGDETSQAIVLNPANLAWLPAPELRWTWVRCPDEAVKTGCGHAWEAATPLLFGLSTALRIDLVQPPWGGAVSTGAGFPYRGLRLRVGHLGPRRATGRARIVRRLAGTRVLAERVRGRPVRHQRGALVAARPALRPGRRRARLQPPEPDARPRRDRAALRPGAEPVLSRVLPRAGRALHAGAGVPAVGRAARRRDRRGARVLAGLGRATISGPIARRWASTCPMSGAPTAPSRSPTCPTTRAAGSSGPAGLEVHWDRLSVGGGALFGSGLGSPGTRPNTRASRSPDTRSPASPCWREAFSSGSRRHPRPRPRGSPAQAVEARGGSRRGRGDARAAG